MERHYLEFVVNGAPLGRVLGPLLGYPEAIQEYASVLVTDWPDDSQNPTSTGYSALTRTHSLDGRVALYVCAESGDLGCVE